MIIRMRNVKFLVTKEENDVILLGWSQCLMSIKYYSSIVRKGLLAPTVLISDAVCFLLYSLRL